MIEPWRFFLTAILAAWFLHVFLLYAWGEDYWRDCKQAYEFCVQRPYHRDCIAWTQLHEPLSVLRWHVIRNGAADTEFCQQNPWHASCGVRVREELYSETCPPP